ncbi:unnamed protein product [Caenorhabditis bovis]|uniref:Uncharacterized protein n=1 Tax=Caenorhabditis bovis TaxID=2654633 RepID=A0A8S1E9Q0_9PELO|nr:unnamed protein product [Caenorhabditis bovis]
MTDIVDIKEKLKFNNITIQSQGFSQLLEEFKSTKLDKKQKVALENVYFDCIFQYGIVPCQWFQETLPHMLKNGYLNSETLLDEISIRINKAPNAENIIRVITETCDLHYSAFLKLARRVNSDELTRLFNIRKLISDCHSYAKPKTPMLSRSIKIGDLFDLVVADGKTDKFLNSVDFLFEKHNLHENETLLAFVVALLPFCESQKQACRIISNFAKKKPYLDDGSRLAHTINIVVELCKHDVLEMKTVRRQLLKRIGNHGNEKAHAAYCKLLALGVTSDPDETVEMNAEFREECIKELLGYTKLSKPGEIHQSIVCEAWKSLGSFDADEVASAAFDGIDGLLAGFKSMSKTARKGFVEFLRQFVAREVENLPRPLYNLTSSPSTDVLPLFTNIDSFKDSLHNLHNESSWFWRASLPLSASILKLSSPSNKAVTAVRLIRSCATLISPSTSHEDMISLFASWRICIREALNSLSESKNHDILWARDQICEEGRRSLAENGESVDNVMMILAVLAGIIEEKIKTISDPKIVDEITKNHKPWLISVFEFCATRLPKEFKHQRGKKANPIYQILTQSNKSSLHIAIFCAKLLLRHYAILEFYKMESNFCLKKEPLEICLLENSEAKLDVVPSRRDLWINAEAYGCDRLTTIAVENRYKKQIEKEDCLDDPNILLESIGSVESIEKFFTSLSASDTSNLMGMHKKARKVIEKLFNNGTEQIKKAIYQGLSDLAVATSLKIPMAKQTISMEKFPENSLIRMICRCFDEKSGIDDDGLRELIRALISHKRSDGKRLPQANWLGIIEKTNWKNSEPEQLLAVVCLACEQNIEEIVFEVLNDIECVERHPKILEVFAEHLHAVINMVSSQVAEKLIRRIIEKIRSESEIADILKESIRSNQRLPIVRTILSLELPPLSECEMLSDCLLDCLIEPQEFVGCISRNYDFWIESRKADDMKMKRLCELYAEEADKNTMLAILSIESDSLSVKRRFEKILDVISVSRISRSSSLPMDSFLPIIMALLVSASDQFPLHWFGYDSQVLEIMMILVQRFWNEYTSCQDFEDNVKHLVSFLMPYLKKEDSYPDWQRTTAKYLLRSIFAKFPSKVMPIVENEPDQFFNILIEDL